MTPLPYVPIEPGFETSRRMMRLKRALPEGQEIAALYVLRLLLWAGVHAPDGDLKDATAEDLAEVCQWDGEPVGLLQALLDTGWLTQNGTLVIDGWDRHGGQVLEQRKRWNERQKRHRDSR